MPVNTLAVLPGWFDFTLSSFPLCPARALRRRNPLAGFCRHSSMGEHACEHRRACQNYSETRQAWLILSELRATARLSSAFDPVPAGAVQLSTVTRTGNSLASLRRRSRPARYSRHQLKTRLALTPCTTALPMLARPMPLPQSAASLPAIDTVALL